MSIFTKKSFNPDRDVKEYTGRYFPYDIVREGVIAIVVVLILTLGFATLFGSPDEKQVTLRQWSNAAPLDFAQTALAELNGSAGTAGYGAPYNTASEGMKLFPLALQKWGGVRIPIDATRDFILLPLTSLPNQPDLHADLMRWAHASADTHTAWINAYGDGTQTLSFTKGHLVSNIPTLTSTNGANPLPVMLDQLTSMARTGALDQALIAGKGFYAMDYTKPLLFLADGGWFAGLADHQHLSGDQWGMMNETGSYPGQAWLWLYTFWYQVPAIGGSDNADVLVWALMMVLTLGLILVPFIPGLRSIPRWSRVYRLIWREHYRDSQ